MLQFCINFQNCNTRCIITRLKYANIRIDIEVRKVLQRIKTEKIVNTLSNVINVINENLEEIEEM